MSKAVLISIKPEWCGLIANREKTVEVRKTRPKIETPFKVYIYFTKSKGYHYWIGRRHPYADDIDANGKVVGEFICNKITKIVKRFEADGTPYFEKGYVGHPDCLTFEQMDRYLQGATGYGWHISNLKFYDKPRAISGFGLTRAPQSWCYVEV